MKVADAAHALADVLRSSMWPRGLSGTALVSALQLDGVIVVLERASDEMQVAGRPFAVFTAVARCPEESPRAGLLMACLFWITSKTSTVNLDDSDRRWLLLEIVEAMGARADNRTSPLLAAIQRFEAEVISRRMTRQLRNWRSLVWSLCRSMSELRILYLTTLSERHRGGHRRDELHAAVIGDLQVSRVVDVVAVARAIACRWMRWLHFQRHLLALLRISVNGWHSETTRTLGAVGARAAILSVLHAEDYETMKRSLRDTGGPIWGEVLAQFVDILLHTHWKDGGEMVRMGLVLATGFDGTIPSLKGRQIVRLRRASPQPEQIEVLKRGPEMVPVAPLRWPGRTEVLKWTTTPNPTPSDHGSPANADIRIATLHDVLIHNDGSQTSTASQTYYEGFQARRIEDDGNYFDPRFIAFHPSFQGATRNHVLMICPERAFDLEVEYGCLANGHDFRQNFGHFLYQTVPNLLALRTLRSDLQPSVLMIGPEASFYRPYLDWLGLDDELICLDGRSAHCERLLVFEEPDPAAINYTKWALARSVAPSPKPELSPFGSRVYLKRGNVHNRLVDGEEEVEELLRRRGFEPVQMDVHSPEVQVAILEAADVIVGAHGSAFANLIFCHRPKILIEGATTVGSHMTSFLHWHGFEIYPVKMHTALGTRAGESAVRTSFVVSELVSVLDTLGIR